MDKMYAKHCLWPTGLDGVEQTVEAAAEAEKIEAGDVTAVMHGRQVMKVIMMKVIHGLTAAAPLRMIPYRSCAG